MAPTGGTVPRGFAALWTTVALDMVGFGLVFPVLGVYAERFGAGGAEVGLLVALYSVAQIVAAPLWGRVSDRFGRRPVLVVALVGSAVGSLLTGLAGSLALLYVGRVVDGASGGTVSVAQAAVTDLSDPDRRPRLLGLLGSAFALGLVLGPTLGAVAGAWDVRAPFLIAAALELATAVVAWRRVPETAGAAVHGRRGRTATGAAPSQAAQSDAALSDAGAVDAGSVPLSDAALSDAGAVDAGSVPLSDAGAVDPASSHAAPLRGPGLRTLVTGPMRRWLVVAFCASFAFSGFEATFSLFGLRRFGFTVSTAAAVFAAIGVGLALVQGVLVGPVVDRLGPLRAMRWGLIGDALGLAVMAAAATWIGLGAALAVLVAGHGVFSPALSSHVSTVVPAGSIGAGFGSQQSASALARVIGPVAAGLAFDRIAPGAAYMIGALVAVFAATVLVPGRPRRVAPMGAP